MDGDKPSSADRKPASDSHVPPPTDPYVTYQTPYPRRSTEDAQNPFIEFRRLADSAFSSFFSGLPKLLGTENFKAANQQESEREFARAFDEQARQFEGRIAEMVRLRAEEAEGFRKQIEQESEEKRRESEKCADEEHQRWEMMRRGLERCPGLQSYGMDAQNDNTREAGTELDLYDGLRAYEAEAYKPRATPEPTVASECPWKDGTIEKNCPWDGQEEKKGYRGWLSGLGFDGRRRAKNIPLYVPGDRQGQTEKGKNVEWKEYDDKEMDPFDDDDHLVPWFKLSPYSPLSLMNDDAWEEAFGQPRPASMPHRPLSDFPFDEAFEDLMAVHKTGRLPCLLKQLIYTDGPNQWMMHMVQRGVLGPKWEEAFMAAGLLNYAGRVGAVEGNRWRGFDGFKKQWSRIADREFGSSPSHTEEIDGQTDHEDEYERADVDRDLSRWEEVVRNAFEPSMKEAYDQMEELAQAIFGEPKANNRPLGARGMIWPSPEDIVGASSDAKPRTREDEYMPKSNVGHAQESPWSSVSTSSWTSTPDPKPENLISTFTTTTTRTLPDGSVETKMILKKRFADGTEEKSESTEVQASPSAQRVDQATQTAAKKSSRNDEMRGGWFWNR